MSCYCGLSPSSQYRILRGVRGRLGSLGLQNLELMFGRISRRIKSLASDPQIWKALFYDRFVRPRASRIPGIRSVADPGSSLFYASRRSKWLQDEHFVRSGRATNWKRQYKIRHNWARGSAKVKETQVLETSPVAPLLIRLKKDYVFIADSLGGLKVWTMVGDVGLVTSVGLENGQVPTAMAIDSSDNTTKIINIAIGFLNGSFSVYSFSSGDARLFLRFNHASLPLRSVGNRQDGAMLRKSLTAIAYADPFLLTLTEESNFCLYRLKEAGSLQDQTHVPTLISSMKSHTPSSPVSLTMRPSVGGFVASIAYPITTWRSRWSVGLQELWITQDGEVANSRVAYASPDTTGLGLTTLNFAPHATRDDRVTSISYSHPYLLTSNRDNTLCLYLVTSNTQELVVGPAQSLWGHGSEVSGVHIGERGKAVSVNRLGNDLRVWDLEGGTPAEKRNFFFGSSVQVRSREVSSRENLWKRNLVRQNELTGIRTHGWLSFDEEKVVLLQGKPNGPQDLITYDFT